MSKTTDFYQNLAAFNDFSQLVEDARFISVPATWQVVISDVRGSTNAIREGRYKDVNIIGAAAIACVANTLGTNEFPFVFGGDGATLIVDESDLPEIEKQLLGLQALAKSEFSLELRVGVVPVKNLHAAGSKISLGKYQLSPGNYTAQFKGDGLTLAEKMIKTGQPAGAKILLAKTEEIPPELTGLSCRLNPLKSRNGVILCLLIKPRSDAKLQEALMMLRGILNGNFLSARPVHSDSISWSWPPKNFKSEVATQRRGNSVFGQWFSTGIRTLISMLSLRFNIPLGLFQPRQYKQELLSNSDFKKFDETLRMVIDCTPEQDRQIEAGLQKWRQEGDAYGLHRSSTALMTCMVRSSTGNQHIHFIDGGDGGYALAAVQLKAQLK